MAGESERKSRRESEGGGGEKERERERERKREKEEREHNHHTHAHCLNSSPYNLLWDTFLAPEGLIWVTATTAAVPEAENMHRPSLAKIERNSVGTQV